MKRIKIRNKTRNKVLKTITTISVIIFMLSICSVDSGTLIPYITAIISLIWICLFTYANKHLLKN